MALNTVIASVVVVAISMVLVFLLSNERDKAEVETRLETIAAAVDPAYYRS